MKRNYVRVWRKRMILVLVLGTKKPANSFMMTPFVLPSSWIHHFFHLFSSFHLLFVVFFLLSFSFLPSSSGASISIIWFTSIFQDSSCSIFFPPSSSLDRLLRVALQNHLPVNEIRDPMRWNLYTTSSSCGLTGGRMRWKWKFLFPDTKMIIIISYQWSHLKVIKRKEQDSNLWSVSSRLEFLFYQIRLGWFVGEIWWELHEMTTVKRRMHSKVSDIFSRKRERERVASDEAPITSSLVNRIPGEMYLEWIMMSGKKNNDNLAMMRMRGWFGRISEQIRSVQIQRQGGALGWWEEGEKSDLLYWLLSISVSVILIFFDCLLRIHQTDLKSQQKESVSRTGHLIYKLIKKRRRPEQFKEVQRQNVRMNGLIVWRSPSDGQKDGHFYCKGIPTSLRLSRENVRFLIQDHLLPYAHQQLLCIKNSVSSILRRVFLLFVIW